MFFKNNLCCNNCCLPLNCCGCLIQGPTGPQGLRGPTGPTGATGIGIKIDGNVATIEELPKKNLENGTCYVVGTTNPGKHLYVYDKNKNQWMDEGPLQGPQGETPDIGENGNWWIAGEDTGIQAIGRDGKDGFNGEDGDTPEIGANGNWWIAGVDTGSPSRGEKGETGAIFYPAYASFYSSTAQTFPAKELEYSFVKLQKSVKNGIDMLNETDISFEHDGVYEVSYTITAATKPNYASVAIITDEGVAKSNSVQAIKLVKTQTSMSFISTFYANRIYRMGILTSEELTLENERTNLVNASICIKEIPTKTL